MNKRLILEIDMEGWCGPVAAIIKQLQDLPPEAHILINDDGEPYYEVYEEVED